MKQLITFCIVAMTMPALAQMGCTNVLACNFDGAAMSDDGSCEFASCQGCTLVDAFNYDPTALINDGTCIVPAPFKGQDLNNDGWVGVDDILALLGNYGGPAYDVPICNLEDTGYARYCGSEEASFPDQGCTDPSFCNYSPHATSDDGSCSNDCVAGCTFPCAFNYNPAADFDDGSCIDNGYQFVNWEEDNVVNAADILQTLARLGTPDIIPPSTCE